MITGTHASLGLHEASQIQETGLCELLYLAIIYHKFTSLFVPLTTRCTGQGSLWKVVVLKCGGSDRTITFMCAELGKVAKPVVAEKGQWTTAIGPIDVTMENSILHLTVGTGKRYGLVRKSLVISLLKQFQYNLEESKFVVFAAIENARERTLKIKLGKRVALSFNLY